MSTDTPSPRKAGRPPSSGSKAMTPAERQRRWREGRATKQVEAKGAHKIQVSITIDHETLARLDTCASQILECNRSEAIRLLLTARINQLGSIHPTLQATESNLAGGIFAKYVPTLKARHLTMLRSGRCPHEIALLCKKELQQFQDSIEKSLSAFEKADSLELAHQLSEEITSMQVQIDEHL